MVIFTLQQYIDKAYDGKVSKFASFLSVTDSIVYRWLRAGSHQIIYVDGHPKLVNIAYDLPAIPYSVNFDIDHNYILMFSYNGLDYFVSKRYREQDVLVYNLNTIGDVPSALDLDYEVNTDIGLTRFSFSGLFELVFTNLGSYWLSSSIKSYRVCSYDGSVDVSREWESLRAAYEYAKNEKASLFFGESLLYRGDLK